MHSSAGWVVFYSVDDVLRVQNNCLRPKASRISSHDVHSRLLDMAHARVTTTRLARPGFA